jgi:hypothetical protein
MVLKLNYLCRSFRYHRIPRAKITTIPTPRRQYKAPLNPGVFVTLETGVVGSTDEVGEICVTAVDESVSVKMGIVPLPGSPVAVGTVLGLEIMVSTVGLAV